MPHLRDYFCAAEEALQASFEHIEQNVPLWYHFKHLSPVSSGTAAVRSSRPTLILSSTTVSCSTRTRRRWG